MESTVLTPPKPHAPLESTGGGGNGSGLEGFPRHWGSPEWSVPPRAYRTGMWMGLAGITMVFAAFTSALVVRKGMGGDWALTALPPILYLNTVVLLASSLTLELSRRSLGRSEQAARLEGRFLGWWYVTLVLGGAFIVGQLLAWRQLSARGVYLSTNPSSSFFYLLTAAHGLHLLGGIAALAYVALRARGGRFVIGKRTAVDLTALYWHFMDGLWIYQFLVSSFCFEVFYNGSFRDAFLAAPLRGPGSVLDLRPDYCGRAGDVERCRSLRSRLAHVLRHLPHAAHGGWRPIRTRPPHDRRHGRYSYLAAGRLAVVEGIGPLGALAGIGGGAGGGGPGGSGGNHRSVLSPRSGLHGPRYAGSDFFCLTSSLALFTHPAWRWDETKVEDPSSLSLHHLTAATTGAILIQLVLGAAFRHSGFGIAPHLVGAGVVSLLVVWTVARVVMKFSHVSGLLRPALLLGGLLLVQVSLGIGSYVLKIQARDAVQPLPPVVRITTTHVAVGALVLVASLFLTFQAFRYVSMRGEEVRVSPAAQRVTT